MKRTTALLLPALLTAACTTGRSTSPAVRTAAETITAADMHARIAFLASDDLRGRNTPSPGLDTAAQWIADELASFGVEPGAENGWFQRYPYPAVGLDAGQVRLHVMAGATHTFTYGTDFYARAGSAPATAVGVVYVGTGLEGAGGSVRDRAVMVRLSGSAEQGRRGWRLDREARSVLDRTISGAADAGASAVVFVLDPEVPAEDIAALAEAAETPRRSLGGADEDIPAAFFIRSEPARRIFRMAGLDGAAILTRTQVQRPIPLPGVTLDLAAPARRLDDARPPNVVGVIRGTDPELRGTYVVLTAHMDHVGVGRPDESGDSIYNGADDDASGTAALVEVAQAMGSMETPPARSVLFVAVSGEEKGLLGSRWFTEHPPVPLDSMVANVNIDMVARNAPDSVVVIGQEYSSMGPLVRQIAAEHPELGLTVSGDLWPEERFFFRSDHFNFARKEIPALFFFAGTHEDYHRPSDEVDTVDTDKAARVARLVFLLTHAIADAEQQPAWDPEGLETVRSLTSQ